MSASLEWDTERELVRSAVGSFCRDRCDPLWVRENSGRFESGRWKELAGLGVLALGSPEGDGGLQEAVAACEALGEAVFPGPLVETAIASAVLSADERGRLAGGVAIAGLGVGPLFSFADQAQWLIQMGEDGVRVCDAIRPQERVETLAGELWGRVETTPGALEPNSELALRNGRLWAAGLLIGLASGQLAGAVEHARVRRQFGSSIGEFQAVSHPLAEAWVGLEASTLLVRQAAREADGFSRDATVLAAAAWSSARRMALGVASTAHQTYGAVGITIEGPAFAATRRVRQLASLPLGGGAAAALRERTLRFGAGFLMSAS